MDIQEMLTQMYQGRFKHLNEHEIDYVEALYKKIIYSRRAPDGNDEANIRKLFKVFVTRTFKNNA